jgi:hypothetical protein
MLLNAAKPSRIPLLALLICSSLAVSAWTGSAKAQSPATETARTIDVDIEVWEVADPDAEQREDLGDSSDHAQLTPHRMAMIGNLAVGGDPKTKQRPPSRFSLKATIGQTTKLIMDRIGTEAAELNWELKPTLVGPDGTKLIMNRIRTDAAELVLEFTPTLVGPDEVSLDWNAVRQFKAGEVKVASSQRLKSGSMVMQWIKPKPSTDKETTEKSLLVFLSPRMRNPDGSAVVVRLDNLQESVSELGVAFYPRPGRYEMQVAEGWSGFLVAVNHIESPHMKMSGSTNIGKSSDARTSDDDVRLESFRAERPVLEAVYADDGFVQLVARRPGVASLTTQVPGMDGKPATCELQIVVLADTSEIDRAIRELLPQAQIKVTTVKEAALLTGTVVDEDDIPLLLEVAGQFYPKSINRVKVAAEAAPPTERLGNSK